jgi:prepilin peptidase CpaA
MLFGLLTSVVYQEVKTGKILNWLSIPAIILGLVGNAVFGMSSGLSWWEGAINGLIWAATGCGLCFAIYFFIYLVGLMLNYRFIGGGDVKLMAAVGAICGWKFSQSVILWTILVAAVMGLYALARHRQLFKGLVRSLRIFFLMPPHKEDEGALQEGAVFYGLAIAVGSLLALLEGGGFH